MNDTERAIWAAAYSAAFVREFKFHQDNVGFDRAVASTNGEAAGTIANVAVLRYRQWRDQENSDFGTIINAEKYAEYYPKEFP